MGAYSFPTKIHWNIGHGKYKGPYDELSESPSLVVALMHFYHQQLGPFLALYNIKEALYRSLQLLNQDTLVIANSKAHMMTFQMHLVSWWNEQFLSSAEGKLQVSDS